MNINNKMDFLHIRPYLLANGNIGALNVLNQFRDHKDFKNLVGKLEDHEIKEWKICCVYKDICKEKKDDFLKYVLNLKKESVIECPRGCKWK